jgi:predicted nucleic acid-binding protein
VEYWDTSALLKLYVPEPDSPTFLERIGLIGTALLTADVAAVELLCALERKEHAGDVSEGGAQALFQRFELDLGAGRVVLIPYGRDVWKAAKDLVRLAYGEEPPVMIRSLDVLHVATALCAKVGTVVATDRRLRRAATLAGLEIAPEALPR